MKKLFALIVGMFFICASALAAININTATAHQFADSLQVSSTVAKAIVEIAPVIPEVICRASDIES